MLHAPRGHAADDKTEAKTHALCSLLHEVYCNSA